MSVSKSLYNMALYNVRQHYFESKNDDSVKYKFLSYVENWKKLKETDIFKALDSHCAQEIIKLVDKGFKSFFALLCKKNKGEYNEKCSIPKYKDNNSYCPLIFTQFPKIKNGIIRVPIWGRWVTQRTCLFRATLRSFSATFWAALPETPVSTSSKIKVET